MADYEEDDVRRLLQDMAERHTLLDRRAAFYRDVEDFVQTLLESQDVVIDDAADITARLVRSIAYFREHQRALAGGDV